MSKTFRPYDPEQTFLMPASMKEWLPSDHLAYFISDVVDQLDLSKIMDRYAGDERGYPPYHPRMMVKVLLYAYCIGVPSSRKIAGNDWTIIGMSDFLYVRVAFGNRGFTYHSHNMN